MSRFRRLSARVLVLAVPLLLAACAAEDAVSGLQPPGALTDAPAMVAQADWSNPAVVTLTIADGDVSPPELTFQRGRPVRLVIRNMAASDQNVTADGFFRTIAVRQVVGPTGTVAGPWVRQVGIPLGQTKEVWFVPGRYGAWNFKCSTPGLSMLGATGVVNVVQ